MNKRKVFSVVTSMALLFTTGAPSLTVIAAEGNSLLSASDIEEITLSSLVKDDAENFEHEVLKDVKVNIDNDLIVVSGNIPNTYNVILRKNDSEELLIETEDTFELDLYTDEFAENEFVLSLVNQEENVSEYEIDLNLILEDYIQSLDTEVADDTDADVDDTDSDDIDSDEPVVDDTDIDESDVDEPDSDELGVDDTDADEHNEDESDASENDESVKEIEVEETTEKTEDKIQGALSKEPEVKQAPAPRMALFSVQTPNRVANNGIYTVISGDTFNAIARSFNLTSRQLMEWNRHIPNINNLVVGERLAVNRRGVEEMLSPSAKERLYKGGASSVFSTRQEFIDTIAPMAIEVANQEGQQTLWPSLMIAQAAHESNFGQSALGSVSYHNLSGIKGTYNGNSVLMWTWEVLGGTNVNVLADFRNYPSYTESLQDYANLLRFGLTWDRNYYSGTWRSNTSSVWDVLENRGLRGYATDPNYYNAIRRTINNYDLTKYDTGNYYVRTGTFLGEQYTQLQVNKLQNENNPYSYRIERDESRQPYSYRRIETTQEFLGEVGAQRVIDQIQQEQGWSSSMILTGNSTQRYRVRSGFFNSRPEAERAAERLVQSSGYSVTIERGSDSKYRLRTGFFNGKASAQNGINAMEDLGWAAILVESSDSTPHYIVRTGTFNTPNHVNRAENYFQRNGWGSRQAIDSRNNYYYRIYVEGFNFEKQAIDYVDHLSSQYNWASTALPVNK